MHPTVEQLIGWVLGDGDGAVQRHLAEPCADCARQIRRIEVLVATLRSDRDPDAPAAWIAKAVGLLGKPGVVAGLLERIRQWGEGLVEDAGHLVADSGAPGVALGVRSTSAARRLRFESADVELDLELEDEAGGVRVTGQFAALAPEPRPLAEGRFLLVTSSGSWRDGTTDAVGEFDARLEDARDLQLRVVHGGKIVSFEVPAPRNPE